jgi:hypothetical protein
MPSILREFNQRGRRISHNGNAITTFLCRHPGKAGPRSATPSGAGIVCPVNVSYFEQICKNISIFCRLTMALCHPRYVDCGHFASTGTLRSSRHLDAPSGLRYGLIARGHYVTKHAPMRFCAAAIALSRALDGNRGRESSRSSNASSCTQRTVGHG